MSKRTYALAAGVGLLAVGVILPLGLTSVSAATASGDTFISKLAAKLGIEEEKIESAVTDVREEIHSERTAELKTEITAKVSAGKLTQRQADILLAIEDVQADLVQSEQRPDRDEFQSLSAEERRTKMEELRTAREEALVKALNNKGLNTNADEISAAREAAKDAGIMMGFGGGRKGPGFGGFGM